MNSHDLITICNPVRLTGVRPSVIGDLQQDSRQLKKGDVFIAVRGLNLDGHDYIQQAVAAGASVIICEEPLNTGMEGLLVLVVRSTRLLLGPLAQAFRGNPALDLKKVAVTGTNGKTTVATLVWQVLQQIGIKSALLGTVVKQFGDERVDSRLTTSDPVELASDMRKMADAGCSTLAMEVSSHALEQERTRGIRWDIAVFTNLSHDHLDYHKEMSSYAAAKKKLFDTLDSDATAIINMDDPYGPEIIKDCKAARIGIGFTAEADVSCKILESGAFGSVIQIDEMVIETPLVGMFNAYNAVEAWMVCTGLGHDKNRVKQALKRCRGAEGRLERVMPGGNGKSPAVFVDYAHTPDALSNVASTLADTRQENQPLVIVFGCGGDRDRTKRPEMARIAETYADQIIVTSDNPRTEQPDRIIRDIEKGFSADAKWRSILSREEAIHKAVLEAAENAIVLIAGKGHETYQEVNGERSHFDDREVSLKALEERSHQSKREAG